MRQTFNNWSGCNLVDLFLGRACVENCVKGEFKLPFALLKELKLQRSESTHSHKAHSLAIFLWAFNFNDGIVSLGQFALVGRSKPTHNLKKARVIIYKIASQVSPRNPDLDIVTPFLGSGGRRHRRELVTHECEFIQVLGGFAKRDFHRNCWGFSLFSLSIRSRNKFLQQGNRLAGKQQSSTSRSHVTPMRFTLLLFLTLVAADFDKVDQFVPHPFS